MVINLLVITFDTLTIDMTCSKEGQGAREITYKIWERFIKRFGFYRATSIVTSSDLRGQIWPHPPRTIWGEQHFLFYEVFGLEASFFPKIAFFKVLGISMGTFWAPLPKIWHAQTKQDWINSDLNPLAHWLHVRCYVVTCLRNTWIFGIS